MDEYLQAEVKLSRVAGPIASPNLPKIHYSRFGVMPKNHQPNKWRLIVDLSHPRNHSFNDGIPKELCSIKYISIENAINDIITLGNGTVPLMSKLTLACDNTRVFLYFCRVTWTKLACDSRVNFRVEHASSISCAT